MTEIRAKDKLFLAVAVPLALLAAYWHWWRVAAAKEVDDLARRHATLVAEDDFQDEKRRADKALAEAKAALEAERSTPMPKTKVKANANERAAERERAVLEVFREAGLTVVDSADSGKTRSGASATAPGGGLLKATGTRPEPVRRSYVLDGGYPGVVKALEAFSMKEMAVVPDGIAMRAEERNRWTMEVWQ